MVVRFEKMVILVVVGFILEDVLLIFFKIVVLDGEMRMCKKKILFGK